ncbi:Ig-like domain-containing domain [Tannerella sp.]|uniref:Ig-like domain-containing domain n=1 Tax=Tannerella sp. TaxID=2382127 RepID=UPI0026DDC38D|nr:Ig-like domain-containing domain [Tannerella sp.]
MLHHIGCIVQGIWCCCALVSCANMASPNGGPYDEQPPKFVSSTPAPYQTGYKGKRVEILFDELIQIEKPSENVIITPPQKELPSIQVIGKKIRVELKDTLKPDMTYTIDFTNSVSDNNEKNVFENFSFAFSTGETIDSLEISGTLLNAANLEPMPGIMVGLHADSADSAFTTTPFLRTSKTNDRGRFTIRNIAEGTYRLYALNDANRDYLFDQPGEEIAFLDSLVTPTFERAFRQDTAWKDSVTVDTIRTVEYTRFLPDDIVLFLFKEKFSRQYMLRPERPQANRFVLKFNAPADSLPRLTLLDRPNREPWFLMQPAEGNTALHYWITDSMVWKRDTLHLQVDYLKSDSMNRLRPQTDTIHLSLRKQRAPKKPKKGEAEPKVFLTLQSKASGTIEVYDTVSFVFNEPVIEPKREAILLEQQNDTLWTSVDFTLVQDSLDLLKYHIRHLWKYGASYRVTIDSAQLQSIYGHHNDTYETSFQIRKKEEYGHFYLNIGGVTEPAFVELLNANDVPVRKRPVKDGGVLFPNLLPEKYYARLIVDTNGNGEWDTGNYAGKRQPETVYYSPNIYTMRANWEIEETWDVTDTPVTRQKLPEITKNKPKDVTRRKRDYKEEGRSSGRSSSGAIGLPF